MPPVVRCPTMQWQVYMTDSSDSKSLGGQCKHEKAGGLSICELSCREFLHDKLGGLSKHIGELSKYKHTCEQSKCELSSD